MITEETWLPDSIQVCLNLCTVVATYDAADLVHTNNNTKVEVLEYNRTLTEVTGNCLVWYASGGLEYRWYWEGGVLTVVNSGGDAIAPSFKRRGTRMLGPAGVIPIGE